MIKAYWLRILICALVGTALGWGLALVTPERFEGIIQVLVDSKQGSGPTRNQTPADDSVAAMIAFGRSRTVSTQVEMLTSLGALQAAAQKVATENNMAVGPESELNPINLQQRVSITATNDSDVITLRVKMASAMLAQEVAQEIYNAFYDQNKLLARESADQAIKFLEKQKKDVQTTLAVLDAEALALKTESLAPSLESKVQADVTTMRLLEELEDTATIDSATGRGRLVRLKREYAVLPKTVEASSTEQINPNLQSIQGQLISGRTDLKQLLERYTPDREEVKILQTRIAALEQEEKRIKATVNSQKIYVLNPTRQAIEGQIAEAEAGVAAYDQRLRQVRNQIIGMEARIKKLPGVQAKLQAISRDQVTQERLYMGYAERLDSLRVADIGQTSMTFLITPAIANPKPVSPNLALNLSLGFIIGIGVGLFWSIATESRRSPIRTLAQLNRLALQPAYRTIPELRAPFRGLDRAPAEAFESLLVNYARAQKPGYRIGFVGVTKGAGSTVTALNVAVAAARTGSKVLIVESDSGAPLAKRLAKAGSGGPSNQVTVYDGNLSASGGDHALQIPTQLVEAAQKYDLVVFDFLPAKSSSDSVRYAAELDEVVLLAKVGETRAVDFLQVQQALVDAGCKNLTITLSRVPEQSDDIALLETSAPDPRALTS